MKLAERVESRYRVLLGMKLGEFLRCLKQSGDPFYREFLNSHGDGEYCEFKLADPRVKQLKGLLGSTKPGQGTRPIRGQA